MIIWRGRGWSMAKGNQAKRIIERKVVTWLGNSHRGRILTKGIIFYPWPTSIYHEFEKGEDQGRRAYRVYINYHFYL